MLGDGIAEKRYQGSRVDDFWPNCLSYSCIQNQSSKVNSWMIGSIGCNGGTNRSSQQF